MVSRGPVGFLNLVIVFDVQRHGWAGTGSCCPFVFVDQPAEDPAPSYSRCQVGGCGSGDVVAVRWAQLPGPVRAMAVVVRGVLVQDRAQVPWPGNQHPVGDLGPGRSHPALGVSVAPHRQLHPIRSIGTDASG